MGNECFIGLENSQLKFYTLSTVKIFNMLFFYSTLVVITLILASLQKFQRENSLLSLIFLQEHQSSLVCRSSVPHLLFGQEECPCSCHPENGSLSLPLGDFFKKFLFFFFVPSCFLAYLWLFESDYLICFISLFCLCCGCR